MRPNVIKSNYGCRYVAKFSYWLFWFNNIPLTSKFVFIFKTNINVTQFVSFIPLFNIYSITSYLSNNFIFIY